MEDEVDTCTANHFCGYVTYEAAFKFLTILFGESCDQVKNDGTHAVLVDGKVHGIISEQLTLFLLDGQRYLL